MALNVIALRIQADYEDAKAKLAAADKDIAALSVRAQEVGGKFVGWGKALMPVSVAVGAIGVGIVAMAKRGSEISGVSDQFAILSKRANETSETMLGALRKGTQGAISDFDLMKAANRAMGNGLQVGAKDMLALASGAKLLSGATGGDAVVAFETLTNAITKNKVAGLQSIGLNVEHVKGASVLSEVMVALAARTAESGEAQASFDDKLMGAGIRLNNAIDRISAMAANSKGLADVVDILVRGLDLMLDVVEAVAGWFAKIPAPVQAVIVVFGGLLAAAGPVLYVVGQLITAWGVITPLFAAGTTGASILAGAMTALSVAISWPVAAVAALIAIWVKWGDDIKRVTVDAYTAVKTWLWDKLEPVLTPIIGLLKSIGEMFEAFGMLVGAVAGKVFGFIWENIVGAFNAMKDIVVSVVGVVTGWIGKIPDSLLPLLGPIGAVILAFRKWDEIKATVQAVYTAVKLYLVDKFNAIVDSIKSKVDAVTGFFKDMYIAVVGRSYVPDMIDGIAAEFARLPQVMVAPTQAAAGQVSGIFRDLTSSLAGLPSVIMGAIQGGGSVGGSILSSLGTGLFAQGSSLNSLLNSGLSKMATGIGGEFVGKLATTLSSLIPGIGTLIGPLLGQVAGKVVGFIGGIFGGGNDTKKDREKLASMLGFSSLAGLNDALGSMGEEGRRLLEEGLNKIGKKDKAANAEWLQDVQALFATYKAEAADVIATTEQNVDAVKGKILVNAETLTGTIRKMFKEPFHLKADLDKNLAIDAARDIKGRIEDIFRDPFDLRVDYESPSGRGPSYAARGGYVTPKGVQYFDTGGWVRRGSDTVRAMLTPGEFVVSRKGVAALSALNRGDAGSLAGGKVEQTIQVQIGQDTVLDTVIYGLKPRLRLLGVR